MKNDTYKKGVWMPTAQVLCYECHGNERLPYPKTKEEWDEAIQPAELKYGNAITFCDGCGTAIQVDEDVADLHNLVDYLRTRGFACEMRQAGGMLPAMCVPVDEAKRSVSGGGVIEILVTCEETCEGGYWLGAYDEGFSPVDIEWVNKRLTTRKQLVEWIEGHEGFLSRIERSCSALVEQARASENDGREGTDRGARRNERGGLER